MSVAMAKGGKRRIDRILDDSYLAGLGDASDGRLQELRDECEEEESVLSYERSLLLARLDIVRAELQRRSGGSATASLIDRLPEILSGEGPRTHRGAFPKLLPPPVVDQPRRRVEKLVSNDTLARLPDLSEDEISTVVRELEDAERDLSDSRRQIHGVLDRLTDELGHRLGDG
jgi:hypothetical protein